MRSILAGLLLCGTAYADRTTVIVTGDAPGATRNLVTKAFTSALASAEWPLAEAPSVKRRDAIARCFADTAPWDCLAPIVRADRVDRVVAVSVDADGDGFVITASLAVEDGGEPARSREPCQGCTDSVLEQVSRRLAMTIVSHAQRFRATLAIKTEPRGATITIDDKPEGASPSTIVTTPGRHELAIERDGYVTLKRRLDLAPGEERVLDFELTPAPPRSRPTWPLIVVGVGAAAVITGTAVSLTVDPPPRDEPQPERLYSVPGITLAVAGGVAIAAGLYFYLRPASRSSPTVASVPGGGTVGWTTAF